MRCTRRSWRGDVSLDSDVRRFRTSSRRDLPWLKESRTLLVFDRSFRDRYYMYISAALAGRGSGPYGVASSGPLAFPWSGLGHIRALTCTGSGLARCCAASSAQLLPSARRLHGGIRGGVSVGRRWWAASPLRSAQRLVRRLLSVLQFVTGDPAGANADRIIVPSVSQPFRASFQALRVGYLWQYEPAFRDGLQRMQSDPIYSANKLGDG